MKYTIYLIALGLLSGLTESNPLAQTADTEGPLRIEIKDFGSTRDLFAFGPECRLAMPSIHVYDGNKERFIAGDQLGADLTPIAAEVQSRSESAEDCRPGVSRIKLREILGHSLPTSEQDQIVFFFDLPTAEPFEAFSEGVRAKREKMYDLFRQVQSGAKVHLRMTEARF